MKTQTTERHTDIAGIRSKGIFHSGNRKNTQRFAWLRLAAVCATAIALTGTASVARAAACDPAPTTTMVAWYSFDEPSGFSSGNLATQNSGTWGGGLTAVPGGMVGGAINFDGASAYIDSPSSIATNFGPGTNGSVTSCGGAYSSCQGDFSIALWIRVPANLDNSVKTILDKRSGYAPDLHGYSMYLSYDKLGIQLADGHGPRGFTNYEVTSAMGLKGTGWHHLAVTVDRTLPQGITFYLDGNPVGTANPRNRRGSLVNDSPLRIGANTADSPFDNWFLGDMDELQIWNRSLTDSEVANIYQAMSNGVCKP
jgi:Concanavalin A-like lectin/glucanases superfamily